MDPVLRRLYEEQPITRVAEVQSAEFCAWQRWSMVRELIPGVNSIVNYTCLKLNLSDGTSRRIVFDYAFDAQNQRRAQALKTFVEAPKSNQYQLVLPVLPCTKSDWDDVRMTAVMDTKHPIISKRPSDGWIIQDAPNDAFYAHQMKVLNTGTKTMLNIEGFLDGDKHK